MIYKLATVKSVIAKIIADLNLDENKIKITDITEWIFEALHKIGSVNQLDHKVTVVPVNGYQAKLPCGLIQLDNVAFSFCNCNGWLPMRKATGSFSVFNHCKGECPKMIVHDTALFPLVKNMFNLTNDKDALAKLNEDPNLRETLSCLLNEYTVDSKNGKIKGLANSTNFSNSLQYDLKPGYIYCNVPNGFVKLSYYGEYLDDEGMPLIPDNPSYFEAVYWYCAMKLFFIEWTKGDKNFRELYMTAKSSWNFYRKQAYAESMLPDQGDIESIKNIWHTLIPEVNEHDTFYSTTGDRQIVYNSNIY